MIQEHMMTRSRLAFLGISLVTVAVLVSGSLLGEGTEERDRTYSSLKTFTHSLRLVDRHYVDEVDMGRVMRGAYRGLVERLDPFSSWISAEALEALGDRGSQPGVGLSLAKASNGFVRVVSVRYGSPAWEAGIRPGRWIERIEGRPTKEMSLLEAQLLLRGPEGSKALVDFFQDQREDEGERGIRLERKEQTGHLKAEVLEGPDEAASRVGFIRLLDLDQGAAQDLDRALRSFAEEGLDTLVLDLRTNAGGLIEEAVSAADLFLDGGEVVRLAGRKGEEGEVMKARAGRSWEGELALLVGPGTVGEAEALAVALQSGKAGRLFGRRTLGKGFRQELIRFADGSAVHLSTSEIRGPEGQKLQGEGVEPDVEVVEAEEDEDGEAPGPDAVLDRALRALTGAEVPQDEAEPAEAA